MRVDKEFLGAFKMGHRRNVREYIDQTYAVGLLKKAKEGCEKSREALEFLTKFNNEYYKGVVKKGDMSALHYEDELRKGCYNGVNRRNADLSNLFRVDFDIKDESYSPEDAMIECIDSTYFHHKFESVNTLDKNRQISLSDKDATKEEHSWPKENSRTPHSFLRPQSQKSCPKI